MRLAPVLCRVAGVSCSMWTIFRIITTWKVHSQEAAGQLPFFFLQTPVSRCRQDDHDSMMC